jgi:OmcA/MtrC family decaheme c-type cytochrome
MNRVSSIGIVLGTCLGLVACGGGKTSDPSGTSGEQKGQYGVSYFVSVSRPVGGRIYTDDLRIDCGSVSTGHDNCSPVSFLWKEQAVLSAEADGGQYFQSWAGDCSGAVKVGGCILDTDTYGADKWVVAVFNPPDQLGHSRIPDPAQHAPLFFDFINGIPGAPRCTSCHGQDYKGLANAPSCVACHAPAPRTGLQFEVTSITSTSSNIVVTFTARNSTGGNVDLAATGSGAIVPRFGLASFSKDAATGIVGPYLVRTAGDGGPGVLAPPAVNAPASPTTGQLTGTPGNYTYTFPSVVTFDPARSADTHTLWIQASRQENASAATTSTFTAVNYQFNFLPGALGVPVTASSGEKREIVSTAACSVCHDGFKAKGLLTGGVFHGGETVEAPFCAVCHNPASTRTQEGVRNGVWQGSSAQFIHNIHASVQMGMATANQFSGVSAATYPQPVANCVACHAGAAQGDQWKNTASPEVCGSCHVTRDFTTHHLAEACEGCHKPYALEGSHVPHVHRDWNNSIETVPGNSLTNASALYGAGQVLQGGSTIAAVIQGVTTTPTGRPVVTFKLQKSTLATNGTTTTEDVVFNAPPAAPDASKELMNDFVGTIGVYVVFSLPQDGIAAPADFNVSVSSNVKLAWMNVGGATVDATTMSGPVGGYYSVTFPNLVIPADAVNLTAGIGYAYELPGTQPLTQVSIGGAAFSAYRIFSPYDAAPITSGTIFGQVCSSGTPCKLKYGGAIAPVPNVWKAAGAPRRSIVDNGKCNGCHAMLGVGPTFHVGQRNDAPSCSFCHNPNQNRTGWSGNASTFVHAIHGAAKRTVDFGWNASCPPGTGWSPWSSQCLSGSTVVKAGFARVEYPQSPARCGACHTDGTDSEAMKGVTVGNLLWTTVASGTMGTTNAPAQSPYVALGANYGTTFSVTLAAGGAAPTITPAAGTTLVSSPITAACFSCHDDATTSTHMRAMGGSLYAVRSTVSTTLDVETCLDCHGVGKIFDVVMVHR